MPFADTSAAATQVHVLQYIVNMTTSSPVKSPTHDTRAEVPVVTDNLDELLVRSLASAICVNKDG